MMFSVYESTECSTAYIHDDYGETTNEKGGKAPAFPPYSRLHEDEADDKQYYRYNNEDGPDNRSCRNSGVGTPKHVRIPGQTEENRT